MEELLREVLSELKEIKHRFTTFEQRFDSFEQRFDSLEQRFDSLEQRFDSFEQRFDSFEFKVNDNFAMVMQGVHELTDRELTDQVENLEKRTTNNEMDIKLLKKALM